MNSRPILVVEDDNTNFVLLARSLRNVGIRNRLIRCCTAREAAVCLRSGLDALPSIAIVDLGLPDAHDALIVRIICASCAAEPIPVIVYSSCDIFSTMSACFKAGAEEYFVKPWDPKNESAFAKTIRDRWLENPYRRRGGFGHF